MEKILFSSLLKIFIQEGMYKHPDYESSNTFEMVLDVLNRLFEPFFQQFYRAIVAEDYKKLIDKPMSSITRFDVKKTDEQIKALENEIKQVKHHLKHLTDYTIAWFQKLKEKYGKGRERKTELRTFDKVEASQVALANVKLYVNRADGFIGTGLKKDEFVCDCSDIDEIIVFRDDGRCIITRVQDKVFAGKGIIHAAVFKKNDERTVYNMVYKDGESGVSYIKRFSVVGVTRDKEYDLTKGSKGSRVLYFTANHNGEAEVVNVQLKPHAKLKKLQFDEDFAQIAIKGRSSLGNIITKYPVKKIVLKTRGVSTLAGRKLWYDDILKRLNADGRGKYLGEFDGEDKVLTVLGTGIYELTSFDLSNHFDDKMVLIEKYDPAKVYTAVHIDGKTKNYMVKRFIFENLAIGKQTSIISDEPGSKMLFISGTPQPLAKIEQLKGKEQLPETIELDLSLLIDVKGMRAMGNRLSQNQVKKVELLVADSISAETPETGNAISEAAKPINVIQHAKPVEPPRIKEIENVPGQSVAEQVNHLSATEKDNNALKGENPPKKGEKMTEKAIQSTENLPETAEKSPGLPQRSPEVPIQKKNVDLEITNPEDINIDDKGQLGLF